MARVLQGWVGIWISSLSNEAISDKAHSTGDRRVLFFALFPPPAWGEDYELADLLICKIEMHWRGLEELHRESH